MPELTGQTDESWGELTSKQVSSSFKRPISFDSWRLLSTYYIRDGILSTLPIFNPHNNLWHKYSGGTRSLRNSPKTARLVSHEARRSGVLTPALWRQFFWVVGLGSQVSSAGSDNVSPRPTSTTWPDQLLPSQWLFFLIWIFGYLCSISLFLDCKLPEGKESIPFICDHSIFVQRKTLGFYSRFL